MSEEEKKALLIAAETFYKYSELALDYLVDNAPSEHIDSMKYQLEENY